VEGFTTRIADVRSGLQFQDDIMKEVNELLIRAQEVATQAANTTNSEITRAQQAEEIYQIRDNLVSLANSTLKGRYIYGGADDDDAPYDAQLLTTYTPAMPARGYETPLTGPNATRYAFDSDVGMTTTRMVQISDGVSVTINTPGNQLFDEALQGLERLGRAMAGYDTLPPPGMGAPDGTGAAFVFPADYTRQTDDIRAALDQLKDARENDILPERVNLGGRLRRLETAEGILALAKTNANEVLDKLQNADIVESASKLTLAQTALQASLQVGTQILQQSILDFV
jgi:flagellar hook-associated protein 3 FlgL